MEPSSKLKTPLTDGFDNTIFDIEPILITFLLYKVGYERCCEDQMYGKYDDSDYLIVHKIIENEKGRHQLQIGNFFFISSPSHTWLSKDLQCLRNKIYFSTSPIMWSS